MAKCDLCDSSCNSTELVTLLDQYQVDGIRDICPACEKWANKAKRDLLDKIAPTIRAEISAKRSSLAAQPPRRSLFSRLFKRN